MRRHIAAIRESGPGPATGPTRRRPARGALAAAAVLAVVTGCTAQAADLPSSGADGKPGGSPPVARSSPPAPRPTPTVEPTRQASPDATPERTREKTAEPTPTPSAAPPEVLLARGSQGVKVRRLQARLAQIGWFHTAPTGVYGRLTAAAVEGFQGRRGLPVTGDTDTVTWQRLLGMTTRPTEAELTGKPADKPQPKLDPRCTTGRVMCVSKTSRTLSWVVNGTVRSSMDVRFGSEYTPTREGVFSVFLKSKDHVSSLYDTPMPYAMFFSGGQAVHYSSDFAASGYNGASHGCVNVRDRKAVAALFSEVRDGDKVVIHW